MDAGLKASSGESACVLASAEADSERK